jgi:hypothetical protein
MDDFDLLADSSEVPSTLSFPVVLEFPDSVPNAALFLPPEPDRPLTKSEKEWVQEAQRNENLISAPPSAPALRALERQLEKYHGPMPVTKEQWQNYVMKQYFQLTLDPDPKISKPALDALAKTNLVGLHTEVQEININTKSTIELEATLTQKLQQILNKKKDKEEEAIEAEWSEAE